MGKVGAIIPAAGKGKRMQHYFPKQFLPLRDHPLLYYTLKVFEECEDIEEIILVIDREYREFVEESILSPYRWEKLKDLVEGGEHRQESVYQGLKAGEGWEWVVVHDAVRPFLRPSLLKEVIREVKEKEAVTLGVPLEDTLKEVNKERKILKTLRRERLWRIQTPQAFRYSLLLTAHQKAIKDKLLATDDASLVERLGKEVFIIPGSPLNLKITTPFDLLLAQTILETGIW